MNVQGQCHVHVSCMWRTCALLLYTRRVRAVYHLFAHMCMLTLMHRVTPPRYESDRDFIRDIPRFSSRDFYVMRFRGSFAATTSGRYGFQTTSDDGSRLYPHACHGTLRTQPPLFVPHEQNGWRSCACACTCNLPIGFYLRLRLRCEHAYKKESA